MRIPFVYIIILMVSAAFLSTGCNKANSANSISGVEAKEVTEAGLSWYSIDDLDKMKDLNKRVLVDVYTTWCGWCKVMDKKTFTDPQVVNYLNENFILVKFNAEQRQPVTFRGQSYEWVPAGRRGVNKLALEMLNGRMGYPTIVYLDSNLNKIKSSPGYKTPDQLMSELRVL